MPYLWNKLENRFSEIGPDFSTVGAPTFVPVEYNNGVYSNDAANDRLEAPVQDGLTNACMFTFWTKTDYAMINGDPQDGGTHVIFSIYYNNLTKLYLQFQGSGNRTQIVRFRNNNAELDILNISDASLTWNAGVPVYLAILVDRNGIDGGADTMRLYIGDTLAGNYVGALGEETSVTGWEIITHARPIDYVADAGAAIDNLVVWPDVTDIAARLALRNQEDPTAGAGGKRMIDGGVRSNLIDGSVLVH